MGKVYCDDWEEKIVSQVLFSTLIGVISYFICVAITLIFQRLYFGWNSLPSIK